MRARERRCTDFCFIAIASLKFLLTPHLLNEVYPYLCFILCPGHFPPPLPLSSYSTFSFAHCTYHLLIRHTIVVYCQNNGSSMRAGASLMYPKWVALSMYVPQIYLFNEWISVRMPLLCTWKATCCFQLLVCVVTFNFRNLWIRNPSFCPEHTATCL